MYQVSFSNQSIGELNKFDPLFQMHIIEQLGNTDLAELKSSPSVGSFQRDHTVYYRIRAKDLRLYFEFKSSSVIYCHYIIPQHTLTDFLFRFKLPVSEEQMVEQHQSFWKYLETLKNTKKDDEKFPTIRS